MLVITPSQFSLKCTLGFQDSRKNQLTGNSIGRRFCSVKVSTRSYDKRHDEIKKICHNLVCIIILKTLDDNNGGGKNEEIDRFNIMKQTRTA